MKKKKKRVGHDLATKEREREDCMQYAKLPCPSLTPGVCPNSCPLSGWCCCPTFSFSITPFCCPQSFPASGSFPMSQLYTSVGQSIGALASVLPMNIQGWFPLGLTGLIFLQFKGLWRVFSSTTIQKHQFFGPGPQPSLWSNSHIHTRLLEKPWLLTIHTFVSKVMSLLYNKPSRFVIAFLIRSKHLKFMAAVTIHSDFGAQEKKSVTVSCFLVLFAMKWWDQMPYLSFLNVEV